MKQAWSTGTTLIVELGNGAAGRAYRVEGLAGFDTAGVRIVAAATPLDARPPYLRFSPLTDPPGDFDLDRILWLTPFVEKPGTRDHMLEFERRIGRRYYDFMAPSRIRYAAACSVEVRGVDLLATCAELYAVGADTRAEAEALDASTSPEPPDVIEFYRECSALKVPGSGRQIWLLPPD